MESLEEIRKLLKDFTAGEIQVFPAEVLSVSQETCMVKPADAPELKARLKSAIDQKSSFHVLYPKVGSTVLIGLILNDPDTAFVVSFGELEAMECRIGDHSLYLDKDGHVFNGGENGGLIVHSQLLNEYNKTKQAVDSILDMFSQWVVAPADGGLALKTLATALLEGKETGDMDEITNNKVKH